MMSMTINLAHDSKMLGERTPSVYAGIFGVAHGDLLYCSEANAKTPCKVFSLRLRHSTQPDSDWGEQVIHGGAC